MGLSIGEGVQKWEAVFPCTFFSCYTTKENSTDRDLQIPRDQQNFVDTTGGFEIPNFLRAKTNYQDVEVGPYDQRLSLDCITFQGPNALHPKQSTHS